jgi:O-methyltransferase domain
VITQAKHGRVNAFAALYADAERLKGFLRAMTGISNGSNLVIASKFPWKKYRTTAYVGTAQGDLVAQVALGNPHISGTGFDLAEVGTTFKDYIAAHGLSARVAFQSGNFFQDPLPKADVLKMNHILHDWNLEEKKILIGKAFKAIPEGGALVVYESIIDEDRSKNAFGLLMSLNTLIEPPGGFDYTGKDCMGWMKEAGFREARTEHLPGPDSMVIGINREDAGLKAGSAAPRGLSAFPLNRVWRRAR